MALARFSPPAPPLSGHVPRKQRFAPIRQLLCVLHIFPVISYIFINVLSYKNLQPISLRILYLHIIFVFDIFTFNIFAFDIFAFDIFTFDIFTFDIFTFDIFTFDIFTFDIFEFDHLIYLHLIYLPLKFTSILFQKIRRCAPHIETYQRPPTLTLGPTFHIQYRHIPITASRLFHSQQPRQAVLLHRLNLSFPAPSHTDTSQPNSRPPQPSPPKKSPRGVQRGRGFAAPLRFSFFPQKKYCAPFAKKANATQYLKKSISNLLFLYLTTRTLYIPSISLSSSNALADAALSRSIRV